MKWLITGGAGFIGCNTARKLIDEGHKLIVFDNLSRKGARSNLEWLKKQGKFCFVNGDVRDVSALKGVFDQHENVDVVLHLAGQVAVTASVANPRADFEGNALGTFNVLEAARETKAGPIVLNASTNKVYGKMEDVEVVKRNGRYQFKNLLQGVSEERPIDFHSPYGCSKGAADEYVQEYARIYGLRTVNFRQSCIYGYHQFGVEDQGWVAWFTIAAVLGKPIVIYGDGRQVRDVLFIDDLVDCYLKAVEHIDRACGQVYNIGGGPHNQLSLLELIDLLEEYTGKEITPEFSDWRRGDQRVFICDIRMAKKDLGWKPEVGVREGIKKLYRWVEENKGLFR